MKTRRLLAGRLRAKVVTGAKRVAQHPDIPAIAGQALPGFDVREEIARWAKIVRA